MIRFASDAVRQQLTLNADSATWEYRFMGKGTHGPDDGRAIGVSPWQSVGQSRTGLAILITSIRLGSMIPILSGTACGCSARSLTRTATGVSTCRRATKIGRAH